MNANLPICIKPLSNPHSAQELATQLALPLCDDAACPDLWLDWVTDKKSDLLKLAVCSKSTGPVSIDFLNGKKAHRRQFGGGKGQPLVKAMGKLETGTAQNGLPTILDATAGMAGDSFVLANQGFQVMMLERSPIVFSLIKDALNRAYANLDEQAQSIQDSLHNLSLRNADAITYLSQEKPNVDVVYMDPMFPEKKKSAAVKKEMQTLQKIAGPDMDSSALLDAALLHAKLRVVVKRPKGAEPVQSNHFDITPTTQIVSPNTRYDIYVIKVLAEKLDRHSA